MNLIKLTTALIINTACGLVTSEVINFYTNEIRSFGCDPSEVALCIVTRYTRPNDRNSRPDYYLLDTAVRVKPGTYNCGVTTAKCCGTNLKYEKWQHVKDSQWMKDLTETFCPNKYACDPDTPTKRSQPGYLVVYFIVELVVVHTDLHSIVQSKGAGIGLMLDKNQDSFLCDDNRTRPGGNLPVVETLLSLTTRSNPPGLKERGRC
ncbi:uncharacterized protein PGTG_11516 [Puccinia graminis f. sp. tritici CRL 75-36-700-3]|uniref:Hydrophobin n=1 Tax=Puccinia graminis f. sp. tritici (strain CRL 75-36-700-3 / race SCCL) TaxID=418459 RepID=E3KLZ8_PUCGT|nr:uncharacterized protein PGTG_11516 [Puccinia graminis f. sp. tritici CRL 75-36-700-3]EFP85347.2 hypothetical protein PGTG_11516 [Puccinia graminis f. sp. tritici CRL 75-36-700-3]